MPPPRMLELLENGDAGALAEDEAIARAVEGQLNRVDASAVDALEQGDRLLYVRKASLPPSN